MTELSPAAESLVDVVAKAMIRAKSPEFDETRWDDAPNDAPLKQYSRISARAAIEAIIKHADRGNFPPNFEVGERVELVPIRHDRDPLRPGTVVALDEEPVRNTYLRVLFDDGEERQINPDVMRRIR